MSDDTEKLEIIKNHVKCYIDFPVKDILFWDIFSILKQPRIFSMLRDVMVNHVRKTAPTCVAALDSRGFIFGSVLALEFQIPFIPIRKKGKLPGPVESVKYALEYGEDVFEVQVDSMKKDDNVLIVDDLLATGGSLSAACELVEKLGATVLECLVIMELVDLNGRNRLSSKVHSLIKY